MFVVVLSFSLAFADDFPSFKMVIAIGCSRTDGTSFQRWPAGFHSMVQDSYVSDEIYL